MLHTDRSDEPYHSVGAINPFPPALSFSDSPDLRGLFEGSSDFSGV